MQQLQLLLDNFSTASLTELILIGSVFVLFISAVLLFRTAGKLKQEYAQVKVMREDLKAFSVAAIGVGKRVLQLERRQKNAQQGQHQPEKIVSYVEPANQAYDEAAFMAKQGHNIESIMSRCGLSHSEAELIYLMNRLDKSARYLKDQQPLTFRFKIFRPLVF